MDDSGTRLNGLVDKLNKEEAPLIKFEEIDPTGQYIRYKEVLGIGSFKTVYKAFDQVYGSEVAWSKLHIHNHDDVLEKIYSEVQLLKSLDHDNIMKLYHSWIDKKTNTFNMITEFFTSGNLRQYRYKHKSVDLKAIKNWARQILNGLHYLHSQNPPVILKNLNCDKVFVNGHCGEVKIAPSIVGGGSPEFMAPELYDDDEEEEERYNELVDIYSFGMCLLEMVTREKPYSECKNSAQVYKNVSKGVKPDSLNRLSDPQVKQFIDKCLASASMRSSAIQLLNDPFLLVQDNLKKKSSLVDLKTMAASDEIVPMKIDPEVELERVIGNNEFKLRGHKKVVDDSVSLALRITDSLSGGVMKIEFLFHLGVDTAILVAGEMVEQLGLLNEDACFVAQLIDDLIMKLVVLGCNSSSNVENQESQKLNSSETFFDVEWCESFNSSSVNSGISSIDLLSDRDHDVEPELRLEMDAIDRRFRQYFAELLRKEEEAIDNVKRKAYCIRYHHQLYYGSRSFIFCCKYWNARNSFLL